MVYGGAGLVKRKHVKIEKEQSVAGSNWLSRDMDEAARLGKKGRGGCNL